ncbi:hypothetical protein [Treponema brennaborense]|uniref:Leader peptide processing enzyme n=1 Tax=Treponema brennaborense (strain DSM 12168 / CIP 105900 / DD5/3) TaxID=906968 RepID=F4LNE2_TREBD|nr:hypothetical protein [Treponema brennaborense]AEE17900.1 leader peptide processing enzyme [Treponema brennaborense DSM 12168]
MTKKQRTVIFILITTAANLVIMLLLLVLFSVIALLALKENGAFVLPFVFVLAVFLGMLIAQKLTGIVIKKWNLEDKLEPLFGRKRRNRRD